MVINLQGTRKVLAMPSMAVKLQGASKMLTNAFYGSNLTNFVIPLNVLL